MSVPAKAHSVVITSVLAPAYSETLEKGSPKPFSDYLMMEFGSVTIWGNDNVGNRIVLKADECLVIGSHAQGRAVTWSHSPLPCGREPLTHHDLSAT